MPNNSSAHQCGIVFPGQGSQSVGMLSGLAETFAVVEETFRAASTVLGYDLWALVQDGPEEQLNETAKTQPALLAAGVACWKVWQQLEGPEATVMAGHSLGEYTALVCADALDFEAAVSLVAERGRLMQEAVPAGVGAMAAILGLDDVTVKSICEDVSSADENVSAANFNSPGQVVIAGNTSAIEAAVTAAKSAGAKRAVLLPVSVPSHCELMKPAAEAFTERLQATRFETPRIPVIHNRDVCPHDEPGAIRTALKEQLYFPVRWVEVVQAISLCGVDSLVECGPGKVLTGLNKRIDKTLDLFTVNTPDGFSTAIEKLKGSTEAVS